MQKSLSAPTMIQIGLIVAIGILIGSILIFGTKLNPETHKEGSDSAEASKITAVPIEKLSSKQLEDLRLMFSEQYNSTFSLDSAYLENLNGVRTLVLELEQHISEAYIQAYYVLGASTPDDDKLWWATFYSSVFWSNFMAQVPSLSKFPQFRLIPFTREERRDQFGNVSGSWKMVHLDLVIGKEMALNININYVLSLYKEKGRSAIRSYWIQGPLERGGELR